MSILPPPPPKKSIGAMNTLPPPPPKKKSLDGAEQSLDILSPSSVGSLEEQLAQAPPVPAGATVDVPTIAPNIQAGTEQTTQVQVPELPAVQAESEQERLDRVQDIYEPTQVSARMSNVIKELGMVLPRIEQWQNLTAASLLGDDAQRAVATAQESILSDLESRMYEGTDGDISGAVKSMDAPALAYGIFDAALGVVSTAAISVTTFGAGLFPEMISRTTRDYNAAKAEMLGITPEELIMSGQESLAVPAIIGVVGASLERLGFKGITKAILKEMKSSSGKKIAAYLLASGQEGGTEWVQYGLEVMSKALGSGDSMAVAISKGVSAMFSEDGLEQFLKGFAGSTAAIAAGRGVKSLSKVKEKIDLGEQITSNDVLELTEANSESNGGVTAVVESLIAANEITAEQAQAVQADMDLMAQAFQRVPAEMSDRAAEFAPLIFEKAKIDEQIGAIELEKATVDEQFAPMYDAQIEKLQTEKQALNEKIQSLATPTVEQQVTEGGAVEGEAAGDGGAVIEGVQEGGVEARVEGTPLAEGVPQAEPQVTAEEGVQEEVDVFHGGSVNDIQIASIDNPLYVSESESQSAAYAKGNKGKVAKFKVDKSKIANEEEVRNVINELGLKPKDESWSVDELNIYELIDPNFDTSMSDESINNLFEELERRGYGGAEFLGMNIETLKNDINDIVIFNPKLVTKEGQVQEEIKKDDNLVKRITDNMKGVFFTGRGKKYEDLSKTKGGFLFFSQNKENSEWYGGDESNITPAFIDDSNYLDLSSQEKKSKFIEENLTDKDIENLYKKEIKFDMDRDALGELSKENLISKYKERAKREPFTSGDKQDFLLNKAKELGSKGVKLLDIFFGKEDVSTVVIDKSTIKTITPESISEEYVKAKKDGSNPDLVKAVEGTLKIQTDAAEQQSGQVRQASVQVETEGAVDSDMPIINEAELQDRQEVSPEEKQKVINAGGVPAARLLNQDGNLPEARTKIQDYLKGMSKGDTKLLNKAANKQAIKLVNEAETEVSMARAIDYIDKLIANQQFREAFNDAADALEKAPSKLKRWAGTSNIINTVKNIRLKGIDSIDLLKEVADILGRPDEPGIQEVDAFVKKLYDYAQKKGEPKGLGTLESVSKSLDNLLTERKRDADGNMADATKEFDTARKVKNLANRVSELEQAIYSLNVDEQQQDALLEKIAQAEEVVNKSAEKIRDKMVEDEKRMKKFMDVVLFKVVKRADFLDGAYYDANVAPIKKNEEQAKKYLAGLNYYQTAKFFKNIENINNGYIPRNFFRDITVPLTNMEKVKAIEEVNNAATEKAKKAAESFISKGKDNIKEARDYIKGVLGNTVPSDTGLSGKGKLPSEREITKKLDSMFAAHIDDYYGLAKAAPFNTKIKSSLDKAMESMYDRYESILSSFEKDAGISLFEDMENLSKMTEKVKDKVVGAKESDYKIGFYLAQKSVDSGRGRPRNVLKDNVDLIKNMESKTSIPLSDVNMMAVLNERYPDGIKESDLTAKEKRQAAAFVKATEKLRKAQQEADIMRGEDFTPVEFYYPFIAMEFGQSFKDTGKETTGFSEAMEMTTPTGMPVKNPKIRSDRGMSINPDAEPFVINPDFKSVLATATKQVLRDRYLFPEVYSTTRALNQVAKDKRSPIPLALKNRYRDMLVASDLKYNSRTVGLVINGLTSSVYAKFLVSVKRYIPEIVGGGVALYASLPASARNKALAIPIASRATLNGDFERMIEFAREGAYTEIFDSELNGIEKTLKAARKGAGTVMSPDGLHETGFGRAYFVANAMDKFKEITGKQLAFTKMFSDADYMKENRKALKEAVDFGYAQARSKYYDKSRTNRPIRPIAALSTVLDSSKGDFSLAVNRMMYMFLGYAHRIGSMFMQRGSDIFTGANYGRAFAVYSFAGLTSSAAVYQIAKEIQAKAWTDLFGDDEEKKVVAAKFANTVRSPQYLSGQMLGAITYFATARYGSLGKAATYTALSLLDEAQKAMAKNGTKSRAEVEQLSRVLNNIAKDNTYKYIERPAQTPLVISSTLLGGFSLILEESLKFGEDVGNLTTDFVAGDAEAVDMLYLLGMVYNATYAQRTGFPAPFLQQLSGVRSANYDEAEKVISEMKRGKKNEKDVIRELAITAAIMARENKIRPEQAVDEIYSRAVDALSDKKSNKEIYELVNEEIDKMMMPYWRSKIEGKSNEEQGALIAREQIKTQKLLDGNLNENKRIELEQKMSEIDYIITKKIVGKEDARDKFFNSYNRVLGND